MHLAPINVLLVDDHPLFRKGVCLFFSASEEITVVGECEDGIETLEYLSDAREGVDVVLMDLQMARLDGEEAMREIHQRWPSLPVLILTSFGEWDRVRSVLGTGAAGFLLKDAQPEELLAAVQAVHAGGSYLNRQIAAQLIAHSDYPLAVDPEILADEVESLSEREEEVLSLIGEGLSNAAIAERLIISPNTVKTHVSRIYHKLGVTNRTQAAYHALRRWTPLD